MSSEFTFRDKFRYAFDKMMSRGTAGLIVWLGILSKSTVKDLNNNGEEPINNPSYNNNAVYSVVFPLGLGIKFSIDPRWSVGADLGYNFSLSDEIDGYASEWSEYNDSYYNISVRAIYKIRNDKNGKPVFKKLYR